MTVKEAFQQEEYLKELYSNRFDYKQRKAKVALWKVLIKDFLQKHVGKESDILDIGGGYCEFINHVQGRAKYLIDLNPDAKAFANPDVNIFNLNILNLNEQEKISRRFDKIFISNFFEHLNSKEELIEILLFCFKKLKPGGSLLIIQPNFKYSFREYYDFIDHHLPITHLSLQELLQTIGFKIDILIPRFLPYSTKGKPSSPSLLRIYLKFPFVWNFLGAQMFINASKPL
jgi:SAM-dependent methyltransferase